MDQDRGGRRHRGDWEGRFPHRKKVKGQLMTVDADIPWFRFLSRWALFAGLVDLGTLLLSVVLFVPGPQASSLPEEYGELVVAISISSGEGGKDT
jgi:hypothetical protein